MTTNRDSQAASPGPFETEQDASQSPAVRAIYETFRADPGVGKMAPHNLRMMLDAVGAAGVYVGAYDVSILEWLAGFEPATCAVIAGLITRAAEQTSARQVLDKAITAYGESLGVPPREGHSQRSPLEQMAHMHDPPERTPEERAELRERLARVQREAGETP